MYFEGNVESISYFVCSFLDGVLSWCLLSLGVSCMVSIFDEFNAGNVPLFANKPTYSPHISSTQSQNPTPTPSWSIHLSTNNRKDIYHTARLYTVFREPWGI